MKKFPMFFSAIISATIFIPAFAAASPPGASDLFSSGTWIIELGGGASNAEGQGLSGGKKQRRRDDFSAAAGQNSGMNHMFSFNRFRHSQTREADGKNARIGFEYGLANWFGLGASIESSKLTVKRSGPDAAALFLFAQNSGTAGGSSGGSAGTTGGADMRRFNERDLPAFNTLDLTAGFHFPGNARIDPFLRIAVGIGRVDGEDIRKSGAALGIRFLLGSRLTLGIEAYGNWFDGPGSGGRGRSASIGNDVQETGGRSLVGFRF